MPNDQTLSIIIKLQDDASAGLAAIAENVKAATSKVGSSLTTFGTQMSGIGSTLTSFGSSMRSAGMGMSVGLSLPIIAVGKDIVDTSMKFSASMELIRTQAGASQAEVDAMTQSVLALSKSGETGQGPQALADGLFHIESLGYRGAQALDILKTSAQAADTGMANMEDVANALGASLVTGIPGTQSANQAMGILNATIGAGNMRMQDLAAALGTGILPAANNFGLTLTDVGAALATLTDNGMRADESATRLRMTFSLMAAPTKKAQDALATIGLTSDQLANDMRKPNGLVTAVDDLKSHLEASGQTATQQAATLSEAFGGGRTSAAILTLVQQSDRLATKMQQISENAGTFNDSVAATHLQNQYKYNAAIAQMQSTLIDIGGTVMPIFVQVLQQATAFLAGFAAWWDKLSPATQGWIVKGLALLAILGPLLVILGSLATAIGSIFTVIGTISTAFGGLATAVAGGQLALSGFALAAAPWLITFAAIAAAIVAITNAFNGMQDAASGAMASASNLTSESDKLTPLINKATGDKKTQLQALQKSAQDQAAATAAIGERYTGGAGFVHAITDYLHITSAPGSTPTPAPVTAKPEGLKTYNFNFNAPVAGDDGIKQIIQQTIGTINRTSTLRMAGT